MGGMEYHAVPLAEKVSPAGAPRGPAAHHHFRSSSSSSRHGNGHGNGAWGDDSEEDESCSAWAVRTMQLVGVVLLALVLGFCMGRKHPGMAVGGGGGRPHRGGGAGAKGGLLPPSAFVPEIPMKEVKFEFPTPYEDTGVAGDMLWNALMPIGSGFVRVPHPRQYDMPESKAIDNDPEDAEIYSVSVLHQLHCLGVIRDVVKKYEKKDKSRFAGAGHEYHCIDYLRQSIMCAGDTTLDFAEAHAAAVGGRGGARRGFSGANSTHQCRDWDSIVTWAVDHREGDKQGIA